MTSSSDGSLLELPSSENPTSEQEKTPGDDVKKKTEPKKARYPSHNNTRRSVETSSRRRRRFGRSSLSDLVEDDGRRNSNLIAQLDAASALLTTSYERRPSLTVNEPSLPSTEALVAARVAKKRMSLRQRRIDAAAWEQIQQTDALRAQREEELEREVAEKVRIRTLSALLAQKTFRMFMTKRRTGPQLAHRRHIRASLTLQVAVRRVMARKKFLARQRLSAVPKFRSFVGLHFVFSDCVVRSRSWDHSKARQKFFFGFFYILFYFFYFFRNFGFLDFSEFWLSLKFF